MLVLSALTLCVVLAVGGVLVGRAVSDAGPTTVDQGRPGPVLLVPGYGGSTGSLQDLAARLTAAGRSTTVVDLPGDGTGDLQAAAAVLDESAHAALARSGADSVDIVGYSAGGIVARLFVAEGGAAITRRVVLLGSPNHGTTLADLVNSVLPEPCPEACRQLATDSDLLRRLNADDETPSGPTWVSVWTTQDATITPPDSAQLSGALNLPVQSICANAQVQHSNLPRDPLVQAIVLLELGAGATVPLSAADCGRLVSS
jgi:triacylglycerol esterase/lipase EstA (alpha/beta hydrolase family)